MAQSNVQVQANYITNMQSIAAKVQDLATSISNAMNLYNGAGLSGSFTDAEVQAIVPWLTAALVGTYTSNLQTLQAAMSTAIIQNMANCSGSPRP